MHIDSHFLTGMSAIKYTPTFLRSALVNDPFCLGDLGPQDVLRIEAEFPELFENHTQKKQEVEISDSSPASPEVNSPANPKSKTTPKKIGATAKVGEVQTSLPPSPTSKSFCRHETGTSSVCSRGDRCASCDGAYARVPPPPHIPVRYLNKFPLRKGPLPSRNQDKTLERQSSPDLGKHTFNRPSTRPFTAGAIAQRSRISPASVAQTSALANSYGPRRKSDGQLRPLDGTPPRPQSATLRNSLRTSPYKNKVVVLHKMEQSSRRPWSPLTNAPPKLSAVTNSERQLLAKIRNLSTRIKEQRQKKIKVRVKLKSSPDLGIKNKGESPRTISLGRSVDVHLPPNAVAESDSDEGQSSSASSSCSEYSAKIARARNEELSELSGKTSEVRVKFQNQPKSESTPQPLGRNEVVRHVPKLEQLVLTRILATKYETDGRLQKSDDETRVKSRSKGNAQKMQSCQPDRASTRPCSSDELLEQLIQEIIQVEILKYRHTEARGRLRRETAAQLAPDSPDSENDFLDLDEDEKKGNEKTKSKDKLSVIDEESINLITPELTPPETRYQQRTSHARKPVREYENDEDSEDEVRTPEITPVYRNRNQSDRKHSANEKPENHTSHPDITDCSSLSDFILSENEKLLMPPKNANAAVDIENISTPSKTSVTSKKTSSISTKHDSVSTPMNSALPEPGPGHITPAHVNKKVQTSEAVVAAHSEKTGSKKRHTHSRSKNSLSALLSGLGIRISDVSMSKRLEAAMDPLSEGEFLHTPFKSNGEVSSVSSVTSPGLIVSSRNGHVHVGDVPNKDYDDVTDYENLSSILEADAQPEDFLGGLSDGEAPWSTSALLSNVDRLLNELH